MDGGSRQQVVAELAGDALVEGCGVGGVGGMDEAVAVHGEVQEQCGVAPHALVVQIHEVVGRAHLLVFLLVVEPSRADGNIAFGGHPCVAVGVPRGEFLVLLIAGIDLLLAEEGPVGWRGVALFVSHPPAAGTSVAEDDDLGLKGEGEFVGSREVVVVALVDVSCLSGSAVVSVAAVGSVEPYLEEGTVAREQFLELGVVVLDVERGGVGSLMAIPG